VQRHLRIGYNRAARLIEQMERSGLVSAMQSNGNRKFWPRSQPQRRRTLNLVVPPLSNHSVENFRNFVVKSLYYYPTTADPFIPVMTIRGGRVAAIERTQKHSESIKPNA